MGSVLVVALGAFASPGSADPALDHWSFVWSGRSPPVPGAPATDRGSVVWALVALPDTGVVAWTVQRPLWGQPSPGGGHQDRLLVPVAQPLKLLEQRCEGSLPPHRAQGTSTLS